MRICIHKWEKLYTWPGWTYRDYFGFRVRVFPYKCKKCGKEKNKKFHIHRNP